MKVLLIDDDPDFRELTSTALEARGIEHSCVGSAEEGASALQGERSAHFDLILLDIDMPGPKGWDVLLELRERGNEIPVIFVTGVESTEERVRGLRLGADDYVVKPVEYEELVARMEAVMRRRRSLEPIQFGDLRLDLAYRRAERNGKRIDLTPREYDLLLALVRADGEVIPRKTLHADVWGMTFDPGTNLLDVHIGRLRKKLDRYGRPLIETVRGTGYRILRHEPATEDV